MVLLLLVEALVQFVGLMEDIVIQWTLNYIDCNILQEI